MYERAITPEFQQLLKEYPVVTVLGARQSGKTTLAQTTLPDWPYCNLELPENRQLAAQDPKAFLAQFPDRVILDEIQRVPELLSYIQVTVDERKNNGQFVLTGSHQLSLREAITQSLAGRTGILNLYPFSISELQRAGIEYDSSQEYIYRGFLPRIYDQQQRPTQAYSNYYQTYVERDVRQLINLKDLSLFEKFIKLLAGRAGQLMDYNSLANDVGVSAKSIKNWLSILEASFIIYKLPPYYENFGKRMVKSPKYYFTDTGLLAYLLGIETPAQVARDPLVGQMFENLVVIECIKTRANRGMQPQLYFFRDSNGNEVDILFESGRELVAVEIKASMTYQQSLLKGLKRMQAVSDRVKQSYLIYAGEDFTFSNGTRALPYTKVEEII